MGDQQSTMKQPRADPHAEDDSLLPIERTWQNAWRYVGRSDRYELLRVSYGGQHFEYSDTRLGIASPMTDGNIVLEIFWNGELEDVRDQAAFKAEVARKLLPVAASASFSFPMRAGGCMMPLIAVPVELSQEDAFTVGALLFDGFGGPYPEKNMRPAHGHGAGAPPAAAAGPVGDDSDGGGGDSSPGSFTDSEDLQHNPCEDGDDDTTDSMSD